MRATALTTSFACQTSVINPATKYRVPTVSAYRYFAASGGLMAYRSSCTDAYSEEDVSASEEDVSADGMAGSNRKQPLWEVGTSYIRRASMAARSRIPCLFTDPRFSSWP